MDTPLTQRETQLVQLNVLKTFADICDREGLTYFLYYGTLIGAIRHKGFIPWDDDIDVAMPRPDYEKFIAWCRANKDSLGQYSLMHWSTNGDYIYPIARFCDTGYYIDYSNAKDYGLGVFIDLYPLDGWGNTPEEAPGIYNRFSFYKTAIALAGLDSFKKSESASWKTPLKWAGYHLARLVPASSWAKKMDSIAMNNYPYEKSDYVGNITWTNVPKERAKKTDLIPIKWQFEDGMFSIPSGYDQILTDTYGDYMSFPPEEERIAHHYYKTYKKQ